MEKATIRAVDKDPIIVHCSSLTILKDESRLTVWYEGPYETSSETVLQFATMTDGVAWRNHATIKIPGTPLGNPVLFRVGESPRVYIVYSVLLEETWDESLLCWSYSDDNGHRWTDPTLIRTQRGLMAKTHPVVNNDGRLLLPLYNHTRFCPYLLVVEDLDRPTQALLTAETMARDSVIQPSIAQVDRHNYIMLARTNKGSIWRSISSNNGYSWTIFQPTPLPNPNSAVDIVRIPNGNHVLAFNPSSYDRKTLAIALSQDGLRTFEYLHEVETGDGEYSYPSLVVAGENTVELSYTIDRHTIAWASIPIDEIKDESHRLEAPMSLGF